MSFNLRSIGSCEENNVTCSSKPYTQTQQKRVEWGHKWVVRLPHANLPTFTEGCSEMKVLNTAMTSSCSRIFLKSVKALPAVVCQGGTTEPSNIPLPHCTVHTQATTHSAGSKHLTTPSRTALQSSHETTQNHMINRLWMDDGILPVHPTRRPTRVLPRATRL